MTALINKETALDIGRRAQTTLDTTKKLYIPPGEYDAAGDPTPVLLTTPLFLDSGCRIYGEHAKESAIQTNSYGIITGMARGQIPNECYIPGGFRTKDTALIDCSGSMSFGPVDDRARLQNWNTVTSFRIKGKFTKNYPGNWGAPQVLGGANDSEEGWGPQPSPVVFFVDGSFLRVVYRLQDGRTFFHDTPINPGQSQIVLDTGIIDLVAKHGQGSCLIKNKKYPFGIGSAPVCPGGQGRWGDHGQFRDIAFQDIEFFWNGRSVKLIGARPSVTDQTKSLPIAQLHGGFNTYMLAFHKRQSEEAMDLRNDASVERLTSGGFPGHPNLCIGSIQGGFGVKVSDVWFRNGTVGTTSLGNKVDYPIDITGCLYTGQYEAIKLCRASGVTITRTKLDFSRRCCIHNIGSNMRVDGELMMAPPGHPESQECIIDHDGGRGYYNNLNTDIEHPPPHPTAFMLFRPAHYDQSTFKTVAEISGCLGARPLVKIVKRQKDYAWGQSYLKVSGGSDEERIVQIGDEFEVVPDGIARRF